ncbi:hypothetical protein MBLNU459_g5151t2 [Dothideomycetes sp. NU459]
MSMSLKTQVVFAFLFRFPVAVFAIIHSQYVDDYTNSKHPGLAIVNALVWQESELGWSIVSASIPNLKGFMKSFSTGFGFEPGGVTTMSKSRSQNVSGSQSRAYMDTYALDDLAKRPSSTARVESSLAQRLNPEQNEYSIEIRRDASGAGESDSIGSGKSQDMIIRKEVTMKIDYKRRGKHTNSQSLMFDG